VIEALKRKTPAACLEAETGPGVYDRNIGRFAPVSTKILALMPDEISHPDLEHALSLERFARYLDWAGGDRERAIHLYTLNTRISESLYVPLQTLEVVLRNRIHTVMTGAYHERWFCDFLLAPRQPEQLSKAIQDITDQKKEATPGRIVAELTFGFWTSMIGTVYEDLWQRTLHRIGKRPDGKGLQRKDFSRPLAKVRLLRNRVAHHEPIIKMNLCDRHDRMLEMVGWLSPAAADWCRKLDRFDEVYPKGGIALAEAVTAIDC
jgi:Abi-like protein